MRWDERGEAVEAGDVKMKRKKDTQDRSGYGTGGEY